MPFADALFDRWERADKLGFGEGASVYDSAHVFGSVTVGRKAWIVPFVVLDGSGSDLIIGDNCDISAGVHIYTHDTALRCVSMGEVASRRSPVRIGDGTYIGSQSVVVAGTRIGSRCIVGANGFVNTDVPERTIVAGSPAVPIGRVEGFGADVHCVFSTDNQWPSDNADSDGRTRPVNRLLPTGRRGLAGPVCLVVVETETANVGSVVNMCRRLGGNPVASGAPGTIAVADKLLLSGVGAFDAAVTSLRDSGLVDLLRLRVDEGVPILGICLGMQLLFDSSEEGVETGLRLIPGVVRRLPEHSPLWLGEDPAHGMVGA